MVLDIGDDALVHGLCLAGGVLLVGHQYLFVRSCPCS